MRTKDPVKMDVFSLLLQNVSSSISSLIFLSLSLSRFKKGRKKDELNLVGAKAWRVRWTIECVIEKESESES